MSGCTFPKLPIFLLALKTSADILGCSMFELDFFNEISATLENLVMFITSSLRE